MDQSPTNRPDHLTPAREPLPPGDGRPAVNGQAPASGPAEPPAPAAPPLTPVGWLLNNGIYLLLLLIGALYLYKEYGFEGVWKAAAVILGLGFVIFIHELGHFLAAKWCDVHVQTFSIGFGPALPGCSFQRGETVYKIGILPLGGYVNMVGEGPEADENEDYPRSFKNKSVSQRMLIISAGVIMNVLLGCVCFVVVYRTHGVERSPAVVWQVESGSPAWQAGVRSGWAIVKIGDVENPWFEDLRSAVAFSKKGVPIPFVFRKPDNTLVELSIEPRKLGGDMLPIVGIAPPPSLKLLPSSLRKQHELPVLYSSAAAAARAMDLRPGDVPLKASDPAKGGELTPLAADKDAGPFADLGRRMRALVGKPLVLEVRRGGPKGAVEKIEVAASGFDFGDRIVGTTDPATPDDPFHVKPLPPNPNDSREGHPDPFAYRQRMKELAGKPVVLQVRRKGAGEGATSINILVPPAYHVGFGLRMKMGKVAARRKGSPADVPGGPQRGDVITAVQLFLDGKPFAKHPESLKQLDPMRLPHDLARAVAADPPGARQASPTNVSAALACLLPNQPLAAAGNARYFLPKWGVQFTVLRPNRNPGPDNHSELQSVPLPPLTWDPNWNFDVESPQSKTAPMAIAQLGIAYRVENTVEGLRDTGPAREASLKKILTVWERGFWPWQWFGREVKKGEEVLPEKGLRPGDQIDEIRLRTGGKRVGDLKWSGWVKVASPEGTETDAFEWPYCFATLQERDAYEVELHVKRGKEVYSVTMTAAPDPDWPETNRGVLLSADYRLQKAHNLLEALGFGVKRTVSFIEQIYLNLSSLFSGRISTRSLGGPIEIASQAFSAADNWYVFLLFMGIISVNLAVVNFLPIPVLDGGHMVFLIYEKLRGKPPSETVRAVATYVGLAILVSLMIFVFYQDIMRRFFQRG